MKKKTTITFNPKIGDKVSLYYDGKGGRKVTGIVMNANDNSLDVKFIPWASDNKNEVTIHVEKKRYCDYKNVNREFFCGHLTGDGEHGIMRMLGCEGDYYSVGEFEE